MEREVKFRISKQTGLSLARSIYDVINREAFNGTLPKIPVKIRELGWLAHLFDYEPGAAFIVEKEQVCFGTIKDGELKDHRHGEERISIAIDSDALYFTNVFVFLINLANYMYHEMIHEYCYLLGINDCDHDSQYHNARFMITAENHGLKCGYDEEFGFQQTTIPNDLLYRILDAVLGENDITSDSITALYTSR